MDKEKRNKYIITGLVLPIIAGISVEIFTSIEVFKFLSDVLHGIASFFIEPVSISVWLLFLTVLLSIGISFGIAYLLFKKPTKEPHEYYRTDNIFGVDWQWGWGFKGIINLIPLCPECSYQVDIEHDYTSFNDHTAKVECENCGNVNKFNMARYDVKQRVEREIHRRMRTGEYKEKL